MIWVDITNKKQRVEHIHASKDGLPHLENPWPTGKKVAHRNSSLKVSIECCSSIIFTSNVGLSIIIIIYVGIVQIVIGK